MSLPLLEGRVINPNAEADALRERLRRVNEELAESQTELAAERRKNRLVEDAVVEIKRQLEPLHLALRALFGEIDSLPCSNGPSGGVENSAASNPKSAIWAKWVDKFGSDSLNGRMISVLFEHGPMSTEQLRVAMQCSGQSVINAYNRLLKHGVISKSGGKYSLREL
jgi:hypothetical protein